MAKKEIVDTEYVIQYKTPYYNNGEWGDGDAFDDLTEAKDEFKAAKKWAKDDKGVDDTTVRLIKRTITNEVIEE